MHRVGAILGVISLLFWLVVPVAGAEPTPPGPPAPGPDATAQPAPVDPGAVTMKVSDLGASDSVAFYIHHDTTTTGMTFPVPVGLTPVELRARIELPVALRFGNLTVSQDERAISRVKLPNEDQAEIVIPLRGLEVSGGWVNLTLAMTAVAVGDGYCWDDDAPIRLVDAAITLTGAVAARTQSGRHRATVRALAGRVRRRSPGGGCGGKGQQPENRHRRRSPARWEDGVGRAGAAVRAADHRQGRWAQGSFPAGRWYPGTAHLRDGRRTC
jgi:hypothetical protein